MAQVLRTELGIAKDALRLIGDARLRDFEMLWKAGHHHTAVYMAGYAVEEYLKCAICTTLKITQLPKIFEYHNLESLLFYSGHDADLRADARVAQSFNAIDRVWDVEMRYEDPSNSRFQTYSDPLCVSVNMWLNDSGVGLIPWFRKRI